LDVAASLLQRQSASSVFWTVAIISNTTRRRDPANDSEILKRRARPYQLPEIQADRLQTRTPGGSDNAYWQSRRGSNQSRRGSPRLRLRRDPRRTLPAILNRLLRTDSETLSRVYTIKRLQINHCHSTRPQAADRSGRPYCQGRLLSSFRLGAGSCAGHGESP
jgi:hypothetical protein